MAATSRIESRMRYKKYLPTREQLREMKSLRFLGDKIFEPNLWHINRHSVSYAAFVGSVCCFLPIPFQMIPCVILCIFVRCNVPISVLIVWISNPVTMTPTMYFSYKVGTLILGQKIQFQTIEISFEWLSSQLSVVWQPLLLGSLTCGFTMGISAFISVRLYWRWKVSRYWKKRRARMQAPRP